MEELLESLGLFLGDFLLGFGRVSGGVLQGFWDGYGGNHECRFVNFGEVLAV